MRFLFDLMRRYFLLGLIFVALGVGVWLAKDLFFQFSKSEKKDSQSLAPVKVVTTNRTVSGTIVGITKDKKKMTVEQGEERAAVTANRDFMLVRLSNALTATPSSIASGDTQSFVPPQMTSDFSSLKISDKVAVTLEQGPKGDFLINTVIVY